MPGLGSVLDGRYRLLQALGEGAFGAVYEAEDAHIGKRVAIKLLHEQYVHSVQLRPRFEREARALAAMSHPHIVAITDYGTVEQQPYLVMELLEGETLRARLDREDLSIEKALTLAQAMIGAVAYAHARGLVHRDLKPGNVFLQRLPGDVDHVKILDFGFVKFLGGDASRSQVTASGLAFGTPAYMSPEQAAGAETDARSDVYSLGVVLFEMLTGKAPFEGDTPQLIRHHIATPAPPLREKRFELARHPELEAIVERTLRKRPDERFSDASALLAALEAATSPREASRPVESPTVRTRRKPPNASRRRPWAFRVARVLVVIAFATGAVSALARRPEVRLLVEKVRALRAPPELDDGTDESDAFQAAAMPPPSLPADEASDPGWGEAEGDPELGEALAADEPIIPEPRAEEFGPATIEEAPSPTDSAAESTAKERPAPEPPAVNPWKQRVPKLLARTRAQLQRGVALGEATERALREYAKDNRADPRPYLLLAGIYLQRGWLSNALDRYELALRIDPAAKHDPRLRDDLVTLAGSASVGRRAELLLRRTYGADAVPAVDRAIARAETNAAKARLAEVRARLVREGK